MLNRFCCNRSIIWIKLLETSLVEMKQIRKKNGQTTCRLKSIDQNRKKKTNKAELLGGVFFVEMQDFRISFFLERFYSNACLIIVN